MGSTLPAVTAPWAIKDLEASGLTRETWEAARLFTTSYGGRAGELLKWKTPPDDGFGAWLVFPYFDLNGEPNGYHRLKPEKPRLAREKGKRGKKAKDKAVKYEAPAGTPIRPYLPPLARDHWRTAGPLVITEGEKKALCACQHGFPAVGLAGVWSWKRKSVALLKDLEEIPWRGRPVYICFDSDRATNEDVKGAEAALGAELKERGADVRVVTLPADPGGKKVGLDDWFAAGGTPDQFRDLMAAAVVPPDPAKKRPKGADGRAAIIVGPDEHRVNDEAVAALAADADLYTRGGQLVRVVTDCQRDDEHVLFPAGPRIVPVAAATLRERLTLVADWYQETKDEFRAVAPPRATVEAVHQRGTWPGVRRLVALTEYPVLLPDGTILAEPGYHRASGLMYAPLVPVKLDVPDRPSLHRARGAVADLLDVVRDFPFADDYSRAGWVAGLLTPLARYAFTGPAPLFLSTGNVPGCGKGLLLDANALTVRGEAFAVTTYPSNGEELRKRITALLLRGATLALFDNVTGNMGGAEIDALLTSTLWDDRVLGESRAVTLPNLATWYATGNNVAVIGDTMRRVCPVRLESPHERPEERTDISRPDLRGWVRHERPRLLSAALTVLRAYHVAGRPRQSLQPWGSFEAWSDLVRGAVVWAGLPDPSEGRADLREHGDTEIAALAVLLRDWSQIDKDGRGLSSAQVVTEIDRLPSDSDLAESLLVLAGSKAQREERGDARPKTLGYRLRKYQKRNVGGLFIDRAGKSGGVKRWIACRLGAARPPEPSAPDDMYDGASSGADGDDGADVQHHYARANGDGGDMENMFEKVVGTIDPMNPIGPNPSPNGRYPDGFDAYRM